MEPTTVALAAVIGAVAAGLVNIIKALFGRNQNSKDRMDYELELVRVVQNQNEYFEKISYELGKLNGNIEDIKDRVEKLESEARQK